MGNKYMGIRSLGIHAVISAMICITGSSVSFAETLETAKMRSAILYLNRVFKYDSMPSVESLRELRVVANRFDPEDVKSDQYLRAWFEKNAKKLITESPNIEFAIEVLNITGIKNKLVLCSSIDQAGSMAWWLSKKALPSFEVGQGTGKTARELGLSTATHVPRDSPLSEATYSGAYNSITAQNSTGHPNILSSRENIVEESAIFGEGHYARIGRPNVGTQIPILYAIDPEARLGSDFEIHDGIIKFTNRKAITTSTCPMKLREVGDRPAAPEFN